MFVYLNKDYIGVYFYVSWKDSQLVVAILQGAMEISDLLEVSIHGKAVWKCSHQEVGVQCVMIAGIAMMLQLCVDNWDFLPMVSACTRNVGNNYMYACDFILQRQLRYKALFLVLGQDQ